MPCAHTIYPQFYCFGGWQVGLYRCKYSGEKAVKCLHQCINFVLHPVGAMFLNIYGFVVVI